MRVLSGRHGEVLLTYLRRPAFRVLALATFLVTTTFASYVCAKTAGYEPPDPYGVSGTIILLATVVVVFAPVVLLITFVATLIWHLREQLDDPASELIPEFRRVHLKVATWIFLAVPSIGLTALYVLAWLVTDWQFRHIPPHDRPLLPHRPQAIAHLITLTFGVLAVTLSLMTLTALWASFRSPWFSLMMAPLFLLAMCWQPFGSFVGNLIDSSRSWDFSSRVASVEIMGVNVLLLVLLRRRLTTRRIGGSTSRQWSIHRINKTRATTYVARPRRALTTPLWRAWHRRHGVLGPSAPWLVGGILSLVLTAVPLILGASRADMLRSLLLPTLVPGVVISAIWRERWLNLGYESLYPARRSEFVNELAAATGINLTELWLATALAVVPPIAIWDAGLLKSPIFYVTMAASAAMQFMVFGVMFVSALFRPLLPYVNLVTILAALIPITFAWAETSSLSPHGLLLTSAVEMAFGIALAAWGSAAWRRADLA